ncbi:MAG: 16S rRNA (cytidine(1402)-2'-O)-methyltransferase [Gemmatimonadota bacterium]|nr:16S rRNA (cytidine(1402)-2'-O)-methyltransferase [Gemmatimonadota bacterium]
MSDRAQAGRGREPRGRPRAAPGRFFIVATPIGNLADLTGRAREVLAAADHILAEDTRRARTLLAHIGVTTHPVSLHAHNEASRVARVMRWLAGGDDVALVSDAGTPLLSDPGERLLGAVVEGGHPVVAVPGPSAVLAALVASGLPCVPFTFVGFLPRKAGKRARALERIIGAEDTTVLFESPVRLLRLLEELAGLADGGRRQIAVCREMTKVHEDIFRGTPAEAVRHYREYPPRGEVTVVIGGRSEERPFRTAEIDALAVAALAEGLSPGAAARRVAARGRLRRGAAYEAVMRARNAGAVDRSQGSGGGG